MNNKKALIIGITGQDGSYLSDLLLEKGYEVHGTSRQPERARLSNRLNKDLHLHFGDLSETDSIRGVIKKTMADEIYNLAAQTNIDISFKEPEYTTKVNGIAVLNILEYIQLIKPDTKFFQALSSDVFGDNNGSCLNEKSSCNPLNPYACSKLFAQNTIKWYRDNYDIFASGGILFNHESPRRCENSFSKKIIKSAVRIKKGLQDKILLGNLDVKRDWGYAPDFVKGMWLTLQKPLPDTYIFGTGRLCSLREFCDITFSILNMPLSWKYFGLEEVGINREGKVIVARDPNLKRQKDSNYSKADFNKAYEELGWKPQVNLEELISIMINHEKILIDKGMIEYGEK